MLQVVLFTVMLALLGSHILVQPSAPRENSALQLGPNPNTEQVAGGSARLLRGAFDVVGQSLYYAPEPVAGTADGGLEQHFRPVLKLLPATPPGFSWKYAMHPLDGSAWSGWGYFCLQSTRPVIASDWLALQQVTRELTPGWAYLGTDCGVVPAADGAPTPTATPATWPAQAAALSYYPVQPAPPPPDQIF